MNVEVFKILARREIQKNAGGFPGFRNALPAAGGQVKRNPLKGKKVRYSQKHPGVLIITPNTTS